MQTLQTAILCFVIVLAVKCEASAIVNHAWSRIDGDPSEQTLRVTTTDNTDNIISVGNMAGNLDFGTGTLSDWHQTGSDMYVAKFDPAGNNVWARQILVRGYAVAQGIKTDSMNNIVIVGYFTDMMSIDGNVLQAPDPGSTTQCGFVIALDPGSGLRWFKVLSGGSSGSVEAVDIRPDDNVVIGGKFEETLNIDGVFSFASLGLTDCYMAEFDRYGVAARGRAFGSVDRDEIRAIDILANSTCRVVVTASSEITLFPEDIWGWDAYLANDGNQDVHILTLVSMGAADWIMMGARTHIGGSGYALVRHLVTDSAGDTYLTGSYSGDVTIDGVPATSTLPRPFIAKLDADLHTLWQQEIDYDVNHHDPQIDAIALQKNGAEDGLLLAMFFDGQMTLDSDSYTPVGGIDALLAKLSPGGDLLWGQRYGDAEDQLLSSVNVDSADDIIISGYANGTLNIGGMPLVSQTMDPFHAKLGLISPSEMVITVIPNYAQRASLCIYPNGTGNSLLSARSETGAVVDASIGVRIEVGGVPLAGVSASLLTMSDLAGGLSSCGEVYNPDSATNAAGETTFSLAPEGGGWFEPSSGGLQVYYDGVPVAHDPLLLSFNSPDINGDRVVSLSDIAMFAADIYDYQYNYRSDFYFDGVVNLVDLTLFAQGMRASCPSKSLDEDLQSTAGSVAVTFDEGRRDPLVSVRPHEPFKAYLVVDKHLAADLAGWELKLELSDNLILDGAQVSGQAINVHQAPDFTVGVVPGTVDVSANDAVLLTMDLRVMDDRQASVRIIDPQTGLPAESVSCVMDGEDKSSRLRLEQVGGVGQAAAINSTGVEPDVHDVATLASSVGCSPNPFNPMTTIRYTVPVAGRVSLKVYALDGSLVATLVDGQMPAGAHAARFVGRDNAGRELPSGVYLARLGAAGEVKTSRMTLVR